MGGTDEVGGGTDDVGGGTDEVGGGTDELDELVLLGTASALG